MECTSQLQISQLRYECIVIGVSAGWMNAHTLVFHLLPDDSHVPIVVQHMSPYGHVDHILQLEEIPEFLNSIIKKEA